MSLNNHQGLPASVAFLVHRGQSQRMGQTKAGPFMFAAARLATSSSGATRTLQHRRVPGLWLHLRALAAVLAKVVLLVVIPLAAGAAATASVLDVAVTTAPATLVTSAVSQAIGLQIAPGLEKHPASVAGVAAVGSLVVEASRLTTSATRATLAMQEVATVVPALRLIEHDAQLDPQKLQWQQQ